MKRLAVVVALSILVGAIVGVRAASVPVKPAPSLPTALARLVDPVIDAMWSRFDLPAARDHVKFVTQYWRLPGNTGFDATIDRIHARLLASGFRDVVPGAAASSAPGVHVEEYPNPGKAWEHSVGTLAIAHAGKADEVVLSRDRERLALCINSFSTAPGGVTAQIVDVGRGDQDSDYANRDLTGAIVMGDADINQLWRRAVTAHGAIGVVSGAIGGYVNPDAPGAAVTPHDTWNILQWGSIPYDEERKGFGFKATPHAMATLRRQLATGPVTVRVTIASTFSATPARTLVAEIPGRAAPDERIVIAVHVQEPGANDNASGVATLAEAARALMAGIASGKVAPPGRTLTFLWLDEIAGSRQWLTSHPDQAKNVKYMFSMDMTGEDVKKTGGTFLIERYPDPGAVWDRAWDPHTEWGRGNVRAEQLKGDLLNDVHLAMCLRVARKSGWVVNTNPYEGGSDHTVFGTAGIPSVLDWHFTDRYYHTNLDTADKSSAAEMRNVGISAVSTAWLLASAREPAAIAVGELVASAGRARVGFEEREGARLAAAETNQDAARLREDQIVSAWKKWYAEAVASTSRLVLGAPSAAFAPKLEQLAAPFTDAMTARKRIAEDPYRLVQASFQTTQTTRTSTVADPSVLAKLALALDRLLADRWFPDAPRSAGSATPDEAMLAAALRADSPTVRRMAVRGLGRFENPVAVAGLEPFLGDPDSTVRAEAANAVAQAVVHSKGADVIPAANMLIGRLLIETNAGTQGVLREAIARLHYNSQPAELKALQVIGLDPAAVVILLRNDPKIQISEEERRVLRVAARPANPLDQPPNRDAVEALGIVGDTDLALVLWDASYHCPREPLECGWEIRYAAVQRMDASNSYFDQALEIARTDVVFQVRMAALRKYAAAIATTKRCAPLLDSMKDSAELPIVRMEAMSLVTPACAERDALQLLLTTLGSELGQPGVQGDWHVSARAFESLARFDANEARKIMTAQALTSDVWEVRATAARVAATLKDEATLVALADDREPNVRTEALAGLTRMRSAEVGDLALKALESPDYQLIRQGGLALQGNKETTVVVPAILKTLDRLTKEGKDTSRDPRVVLMTRLKDLAPVDSTGTSPLLVARDDIRRYLSDFDPNVASLAADILGLIEGTRPLPTPVRRPPFQPSEFELIGAPKSATFHLADGGLICTSLLADDAPVAVARFTRLAKAGYYDNLTFHRVVSLFVIQGGSPGASEYSGDSRYWRDELSLARHTRGALGLSTRGRDTADGQIFFDLTDQPRLNDDYTVIGQITSRTEPCKQSFDVMDRVLEGAKIARVTVQ